MMKLIVPYTELCIYFCLWIFANLFFLYKLIEAQRDILEKDEELLSSLSDLQRGWTFLSRFKDGSDIEWSSWKYFLKTSWYIYKPGYGVLCKFNNLPKVIYKPIASLATFLFIFVWHGTVWHILIWSVLNYSGITLEHIGKAISKHKIYENFRTTILKTKAMEQRFVAVLCSPLLALSVISNIYLFAGSEIGDLFFEYFSYPSFLNSFILILSLYCCCHVSMALEDVQSRSSSFKNK